MNFKIMRKKSQKKYFDFFQKNNFKLIFRPDFKPHLSQQMRGL
jgi:hypothetical protein